MIEMTEMEEQIQRLIELYDVPLELLKDIDYSNLTSVEYHLEKLETFITKTHKYKEYLGIIVYDESMNFWIISYLKKYGGYALRSLSDLNVFTSCDLTFFGYKFVHTYDIIIKDFYQYKINKSKSDQEFYQMELDLCSNKK